MDAPYEAVHISEVPAPEYKREPSEAEWKPIRIHFGITSFGTNAYVARAKGDLVVEEHTEVDDSETKHEELYLVASGRATFTIGDERVDAPAGTLVYVRDPGVKRAAVAEEAGTTLFAVGGTPGEAFTVSPWERKYDRA